MTLDVEIVGVDGDDTLWRCQDGFDAAEIELAGLLAPWAAADDVARVLHRHEDAGLPLYGFGVKGWALSAVSAAVEVSGGQVPGSVVEQVVALGRALLSGPVELLPGAREAVEALTATHRTVLITKGDLVDQRRKLRASGLAPLFAHVEVVPDKQEADYFELLALLECPAERFLMVGNSEVSDVVPVLALGGWAVHVPYRTTWVRERAEPVEHDRRFTVASLADVPGLLAAGGF